MPSKNPNYKPPKSYLQFNGDGTVTPVGEPWVSYGHGGARSHAGRLSLSADGGSSPAVHIRLSKELYAELAKEASVSKKSMAEIIRGRLATSRDA